METPRTELSLDGDALLAALGDPAARALADDWSLASAMPHHEGGTLLVLTRPDSRATLGLQVRARDDAAPAWLRPVHRLRR